MSKELNLFEEVSKVLPKELLVEYPGQDVVNSGVDAVKSTASSVGSAIDSATGVSGAGVATGALVAAAAGGVALRAYLKRRTERVGTSQAQQEMALARTKLQKIGPEQRTMIQKRATAMRQKAAQMEHVYGEVGVDILVEAVDFQYTTMQDVSDTSISQLGELTEEVILEHLDKDE